MIKSTIVIPNYNGIRYIQACLESLYSGTAKEFEVIVVDNASTDGAWRSSATVFRRYG